MKETGKKTRNQQPEQTKPADDTLKQAAEAATPATGDSLQTPVKDDAQSPDKSNKQPEKAAARSPEAEAEAEASKVKAKTETPEPLPAAAPAAAPAQPAKQGATWPGKLALILSLAALGASGYLYWQTLQAEKSRNTSFDQTISSLKQEVSGSVSQTQSQLADAKAQVASQIQSVNSNLTTLQTQSSKEQRGIAELQERLTQSIQQVMAKQTNTRKDWLLAEVEYLLRLANQRILMEKTSVGALALLKSADNILKETDDVSIYAVRKKLASDIAALESVPTVDVEGTYLKLAALNEQVDQLRVTPLTERNKLPDLVEEITPENVSESWNAGLKASWAKATEKLEKLVVIQHRDEKVEPLMSPEQTYYLQQNLHLMLEQAQMALLQKEQGMYDLSLKKASEWTSTYFDQKNATTKALLRGISEVESLQIDPQLPDISGSLSALKTYLQQMTQLKEKGAE